MPSPASRVLRFLFSLAPPLRFGEGERRVGLALALLLAGSLPLRACNVPVFRFALEHWRAQFYEVYVFHRGPLGQAEQKTLKLLDRHSTGEAELANIEVNVVDLAKEPDEKLAGLFGAQSNPQLPWMVVRTRDVDRADVSVWAGKLDEASVRGLIDSPVRREVVRRILKGETAVWLLLECGDRKQDDEAARRLEAELKKLTPMLKLPRLTDDPADKLAVKGPPLRIAFSVLRLKRDDPSEQPLVQMLLRSEPDLAGFKEPMAFATFGRGNCLAGLIGKGLTAENILKTCSMLLAPCTCDVPGGLPRFDLLVARDWQAALEEGPATSIKAKTPVLKRPAIVEGQSVPLPKPRAEPAPVVAPAAVSIEPEDEPGAELVPRRVLIPATGAAALLVVLTGFWVLFSRRGRAG
jgi:hypothetical protein